MKRLLITIAVVTLAWGASSIGYFWFLPVLEAKVGYNDAPVFYAIYYAVWAAVVFGVFYRPFLSRARLESPAQYAAPLALMAVLFAGFALFVLPRLPETAWVRQETPIEFFWANSWYFLPKSVEILFQQILIAALILALHGFGLSLRQISVAVAALFGGFHLSLALNSYNPVYVLRYTVAATMFGALVPYLILRMRAGFLISYAIHWGYYALDIAVIHFLFAAE